MPLISTEPLLAVKNSFSAGTKYAECEKVIRDGSICISTILEPGCCSDYRVYRIIGLRRSRFKSPFSLEAH